MATILDDDSTFATYDNGVSGAWSNPTVSGWYGPKIHHSDGSFGRGQKVTWNIPISPGSYNIWLTWLGDSAHAHDAPWEVRNGGSSLGTGTVDQSTAPTDLSDGGVMWKRLGSSPFTFAGSTMTVELTDNFPSTANKYLISDGLRYELVAGGKPVYAYQQQ